MTKPRPLVLNPILHATVAFVVGIATMGLARREPAAPVFAVAMLYALINPVLIALRPGWWFNAGLSAFGLVVLLLVLPVMGLMVHNIESLGDGRITLVLPPLVFAVTLVLSGLLRLLLSRKERPRANH